jgi:hypothetical protein
MNENKRFKNLKIKYRTVGFILPSLDYLLVDQKRGANSRNPGDEVEDGIVREN